MSLRKQKEDSGTWFTLSIPKTPRFENAETLRFFLHHKIFAAIFLHFFSGDFFCDLYGKACDFAIICDLKNAAISPRLRFFLGTLRMNCSNAKASAPDFHLKSLLGGYYHLGERRGRVMNMIKN